jgi:F0F1-type ATP synthase membrane subunit a
MHVKQKQLYKNLITNLYFLYFYFRGGGWGLGMRSTKKTIKNKKINFYGWILYIIKLYSIINYSTTKTKRKTVKSKQQHMRDCWVRVQENEGREKSKHIKSQRFLVWLFITLIVAYVANTQPVFNLTSRCR